MATKQKKPRKTIKQATRQEFPQSTTIIGQEKYQHVYDVAEGDGPGNFDMAVELFYLRNKIGNVKFYVTLDDGRNSWLDVIMTSVKDVGATREELKEKWLIEGYLWNCGLHTKKENGRTISADVRIVYNSRTRAGTIYVLAHDQPKPIVRLLTTGELAERITVSGMTYLVDIRNLGSKTRIEQLIAQTVFNEDGTFGKDPSSASIKGGIIELADGRILFDTDDSEYTLYPCISTSQ